MRLLNFYAIICLSTNLVYAYFLESSPNPNYLGGMGICRFDLLSVNFLPTNSSSVQYITPSHSHSHSSPDSPDLDDALELEDGNVDETPLYEIKPIPGKGLGLIALQSIPAGTHILTEPPLFSISMPVMHPGQGFKLSDMTPSITSSFSLLPPQSQALYLALHNHRFESEDATTPPQSNLLTIFRSNAFNTGDSSIGIFPQIARINHDCTPNSSDHWSRKHNRRIIYANRDIEEGEEITVSYIPLLLSASSRRERLVQYGFTCQCSACALESKSRSRTQDKSKRERISELFSGFESKTEGFGDDEFDELLGGLEEEGLNDYLTRGYRAAAVFERERGNIHEARWWVGRELARLRWLGEDEEEMVEGKEFMRGMWGES